MAQKLFVAAIALGALWMATRKKKVFVSFAIEDRALRDMFSGQSNLSSTPYEFTDMSVKKAWDNSWKTQCRARIQGCDGLVALITENTPDALGQLWEIKCAYEEGLPVLLLQTQSGKRMTRSPNEIKGRQIYNWTWDRIGSFIDSLEN